MERTIEHGFVVAVRVLDALRSTSPVVGGPIQVCRLQPDGTRFLDEDEIAATREHVERWIELESDALDRLFD
jgi:proteasome beta subunit